MFRPLNRRRFSRINPPRNGFRKVRHGDYSERRYSRRLIFAKERDLVLLAPQPDRSIIQLFRIPQIRRRESRAGN